MKHGAVKLMIILGIVSGAGSECIAQWITGFPNGEQYLNPTEGVVVGTTPGIPPSALTIYGNEMSTPTGEVFRTDAPVGSNTFWRLFNAGTQYGRLFNANSTTHFNIDALAGQLRMQCGCQPQNTEVFNYG